MWVGRRESGNFNRKAGEKPPGKVHGEEADGFIDLSKVPERNIRPAGTGGDRIQVRNAARSAEDIH